MMPGLAEIYRNVRREAEGSADAIERADGATQSLMRSARELVSIRSENRFSVPPGVGGGIVATPGASIGTGQRTSPGGGGKGGDGGGRTIVGAGPSNDPFLRSTDGQSIRPLSWIEANCSLVDQPILDSLGGASGRTRRVWNCGDHGVFLTVATDAGGKRVSSRSSGGGSGGGGGRASGGPGSALGDPFGQGNPFERTDPYSTGRPSAREAVSQNRETGASGPTSITGDVRAPGVESEIRETNNLLRRAITGDGGAGFRAEGGLG